MQPSLFSPPIFMQALRMAQRDWRAGELRFLLISLMLAVAAVASVGFLVDRMNKALTQDAGKMLGADLVIRSDYPLQAAWRQHAKQLGLEIADTIAFPSMVTTGSGTNEDTRLAAIKAVSENYPLRGALTLDVQGNRQSMRGSPAAGTVWVDDAFLAARDMRQGQRIRLGEREFTIAAAILLEQDRGAAFMNFAPRVMLSEKELASTGLIQNGSRISYRMLLKGEAPALSRYQQWLEKQMKDEAIRGVQIESLETGRPEMRATLDRARQFLALVSLLCAMLAALAIAMSARRFLERHLDACAMLRCLGLTQNQLTLIYLLEFFLIGMLGSLCGAALGFAVHFVLLQWLGPLMTATLPAAGMLPLLQAVATGLLLLIGFAIPPVLQLRNVPHNRVIRREQQAPKAFTLAGYLLAIISFVSLLIWQAGDVKLGLMTAGGFIVAFAVFALIGWLLLSSLHLLRSWSSSPVWRFALTSLKRRPGASVMQIVALALGLMALLLLTVIRQDLLSAWRQSTPPDAPNHFIINIQPDQKTPVTEKLAASHISEIRLYPMIRGRLVQIAGHEITPESFDDERARRLVEREFNLSTMQDMPAQNTLVDGAWFKPDGDKHEASVEQGLAKTLGIQVGDVLRFDVAGQQVDATVTSLRKLDWGSMRVNFFVILNTPAAQDLPQTWITAFRLPPQQNRLVNQLVHTYPNLTIVDVGSMLSQVQQVINQVIAAVEFLFLFTLAAGMLVLIAAMLISQQERLREAGLLRALGATRKQMATAQWLECTIIGACAGAMAATGAAIIGWILARYVFDFAWTFSPLLWIAGITIGILAAIAGGRASLHTVLTQAPLQTLREA